MINEEIRNIPVAGVDFPKELGYTGTGLISVRVTHVGSGSGTEISGIMTLTAPALLSDNEYIVVHAATAHHNLIDTNISSWFDAALEELDGVSDEAKAEGFDPPAKQLIDAVGNLLTLLHSEFPGLPEPSVYPTESGDVEVAFSNRSVHASILVVYRHDGSAAFFSHIEGKNNRAIYDECRELPGAFLREQLTNFLSA